METKKIKLSFNLQLIAIVVLIGITSVTVSPVSGYLLPKTALEKYLEHDIIVLGTIISLEEQDDTNSTPRTNYQIEVLQPIKGELELDNIWVVGLGAKNSSKHLDNETIFVKGQEGIFMLNKKSDKTLFISPYTTTSESQNPDSEFILPPLKLFKAGISTNEIHCKSHLKFGLKASNLQPVCLKPDSFSKLSERQWIK
jgi:hypothetical protein